MSFKVSAKYSIVDNFHRQILLQIDTAIDALQQYSEQPEESVHAVRVAIKKIRSLLRLLKGNLGKQNFRLFNRYFRKLASQLSGQRDAVVKAKTLKKLLNQSDLTSDTVSIDIPPQQETQDTSQILVQKLICIKEIMGDYTFSKHGFSSIKVSLRKIYQDGITTMQQAQRSQHDEDFHEWRKSTKHLFYFVSVMRPIRPKKLGALHNELSILTELLGDDHDLSVLKQDVELQTNQVLLQQIDQKQEMLREQAFSLGKQVYAASTKKFIKQMEHDWKTWRHK